MGLRTKDVLEIEITTSTKNEVLEEIGKYLKLGARDWGLGTRKRIKPLVIFTPNPEIITYAQKNPIFKRIVNSAQINIPDGMGVSWAIKKLYGIEIERLSGADLMEDLCFWASENGARIGLIGGRDGLALSALECLRKKYSGLKVKAFGEPEIRIKNYELRIKNNKIIKNKNILNSCFLLLDSNKKNNKNSDDYFKHLVEQIEQKKIDILFVALGFPKQEYFIAQLAQTLNKEPRTKNKGQVLSSQSLVRSSAPLVLMAVGGSFDFLAGRVLRAPEWVRERRLEWLYRLISEPWRLPRQLKGAEFFGRILIKK